MKIIRIFDEKNYLLTLSSEDENLDEFTRLFINLTDIEWLEDFFSRNETDLQRSFWQPVTVSKAVIKTRSEAIKIRNYFSEIMDKPAEERISVFKQLFRPLQEQMPSETYLSKRKAYGIGGRSWIRVYALKVSDEIYIITGGAIKLTEKMEERDHTRKELFNLERCKWFLKEQGIVDDDGIIEFMES